jgi:hypothetical protein
LSFISESRMVLSFQVHGDDDYELLKSYPSRPLCHLVFDGSDSVIGKIVSAVSHAVDIVSMARLESEQPNLKIPERFMSNVCLYLFF